jgi:pectin methylesterase-like acyl-CoA thioesterase
LVGCLAGCGTETPSSAGTGGLTGSGGSQSTGGTPSGGNPTTGGSSSGGAPATGGSATGGKATGGSATGGKATGGTSTGGSATGGKATGGNGTGGTTGDGCPAGIQRVITVAKDGSGQYTTVQAAVNSVASGNTTPIEIYIKPGTYQEKVAVNRAYLCLRGDDPLTTTLTFNDNSNNGSDLNTQPSVNVTASDVSALNLTFENSTPLGGSQAIALRATAQRIQFRNCRFLSYQDTLYVWGGTEYFRDCYIQGTVDYIFGPATAVFQNCTMYNASGGSAVAAPNTDIGTTYGLVFLGGHFTAASGVKNVALARPWRPDGAAAFLNCALDGHILAAGFTSMSGNDPANARFREYQSTGAGANASGRASYQMTASEAANCTIAKIFGGAWTPSFSQ